MKTDPRSLVETFVDILPDLKATFSIFDQPQIYLSWARRGSLVDLGLRNLRESIPNTSFHSLHQIHTDSLDTNNLREVDDGHVRLSRSCAPDSNFRTNPDFYEGGSTAVAAA
jgi:beta-1,2-xylosyltransferase